jgi:hypothetical protein
MQSDNSWAKFGHFGCKKEKFKCLMSKKALKYFQDAFWCQTLYKNVFLKCPRTIKSIIVIYIHDLY